MIIGKECQKNRGNLLFLGTKFLLYLYLKAYICPVYPVEPYAIMEMYQV